MHHHNNLKSRRWLRNRNRNRNRFGCICYSICTFHLSSSSSRISYIRMPNDNTLLHKICRSFLPQVAIQRVLYFHISYWNAIFSLVSQSQLGSKQLFFLFFPSSAMKFNHNKHVLHVQLSLQFNESANIIAIESKLQIAIAISRSLELN